VFALQRALFESIRDMKLYWSSRSPFVRKVMVAAHEVGIADRIRTQRVVVAPNSPNIEVMQDNPLSKIPTLVFDDGTSLYDSRVICEYPARAFSGADSHPLKAPPCHGARSSRTSRKPRSRAGVVLPVCNAPRPAI
jgi:glutathione S-transferase